MYSKEIKLYFDDCLGYYYFCDSEHPLVNKCGKIYYHRHVASLEIGRWLNSDEHVHHIDENKANNDPSNLMIVSAEEHSVLHGDGYTKIEFCVLCKKIFKWRGEENRYCSEICSRLGSRKVERPTKELLESLINQLPMTKLGEMFGVSDNAVRKWCRQYGITLGNKLGYWTKVKYGRENLHSASNAVP